MENGLAITQGPGKVKVCCWPFQVKANRFWCSVQIGMKKNVLARFIIAYQVLGAVLICSEKDSTPEAEDPVRVTT